MNQIREGLVSGEALRRGQVRISKLNPQEIIHCASASEQDYAVWVGRQFYATKKDYVQEAAEMGCCRKVPCIPDGINLGHSLIYLVHKEASESHDPLHPQKATVFGYFILDGIVACTKLQEMIEIEKKSLTGQKTFPVTALTATERQEIPLRGCGEIDPPSYYFVGPDDVTAQKGFRKSVTGSKVRLVLIPEIAIKYLSRFRGLARADRMFEFAELD